MSATTETATTKATTERTAMLGKLTGISSGIKRETYKLLLQKKAELLRRRREILAERDAKSRGAGEEGAAAAAAAAATGAADPSGRGFYDPKAARKTVRGSSEVVVVTEDEMADAAKAVRKEEQLKVKAWSKQQARRKKYEVEAKLFDEIIADPSGTMGLKLRTGKADVTKSKTTMQKVLSQVPSPQTWEQSVEAKRQHEFVESQKKRREALKKMEAVAPVRSVASLRAQQLNAKSQSEGSSVELGAEGEVGTSKTVSLSSPPSESCAAAPVAAAASSQPNGVDSEPSPAAADATEIEETSSVEHLTEKDAFKFRTMSKICTFSGTPIGPPLTMTEVRQCVACLARLCLPRLKDLITADALRSSKHPSMNFLRQIAMRIIFLEDTLHDEKAVKDEGRFDIPLSKKLRFLRETWTMEETNEAFMESLRLLTNKDALKAAEEEQKANLARVSANSAEAPILRDLQVHGMAMQLYRRCVVKILNTHEWRDALPMHGVDFGGDTGKAQFVEGRFGVITERIANPEFTLDDLEALMKLTHIAEVGMKE